MEQSGSPAQNEVSGSRLEAVEAEEAASKPRKQKT